MSRKWTPEQKAKFKETLRMKREARMALSGPVKTVTLAEQIRTQLDGIDREIARLTQERAHIIADIQAILCQSLDVAEIGGVDFSNVQSTYTQG